MAYKPTVIGQPRTVDPPAPPVVPQTYAPAPVVESQVVFDPFATTDANLPAVVETTTSVVPTVPAVTIDQALALVPVALTVEQQRLVRERVSPLDIRKLPQLTIAGMCSDADRNLAGVLDHFLALVDRGNDPALFTLFGKIGKAVDDAKLGPLADKILAGEASWGDKALGWMKRKSPTEIAQAAYLACTALLKEKTGTLKDVVDGSTKELGTKLSELEKQVRTLESLNKAYGERIGDFTLATALTRVFVEMSRPIVAQLEADLPSNPTPEQVAWVQEMKARLQTAESVALNKEASLTKIPADQEVIRQIQQAGITTYIQTLVTACSRTNSIKVTLLQLHGANMVRGVQILNEQGAALDKNVSAINQRLTKKVATVASTMAGDTAEAQAAKIIEIVAFTKEIQGIAAAGSKQNDAKFLAVAKTLKEARAEMAKLGVKETPKP